MQQKYCKNLNGKNAHVSLWFSNADICFKGRAPRTNQRYKKDSFISLEKQKTMLSWFTYYTNYQVSITEENMYGIIFFFTRFVHIYCKI
jgi:hypothetical protein